MDNITKMKVLFTFTYNVSLLLWDQTGLIHRDISVYKELSKKNVKISFLTYGNHTDYEYSDLLGNIEIIPVNNLINSKFPLLKHIKSLLLPFKLKNLFKNIDLIKTGQIYGSWVACIAKIVYNKKIIIRSGFEWLRATKNVYKRDTIKSYIKFLFIYSFIFLNELIAYKLADGIIVTSDYDIPFIMKYYKLNKKYKKNRIRLIYNYIDESLFKSLSIQKKDKHIIYIGNLHRGKNVINLVKAFIGLKDFHLDIIGEGPDKEKMEKISKENNLNLNFLGLFPNNKIPEILNQYQIFILPSISEGNPKVLLEAMSCGCACIGTDIEGINNLIKHKENGFLCNTNPESIKDAILTIYNDKDLRNKIEKNARKFILENCSLRSITAKEYSFYKEIIKQ